MNKQTILRIAITLFLIIGTFNLAQAQSRPGNTELGVILGEPTGISLKVWQSDRSAFDAAAAWSFSDNESLHVHADYLLHSWLDVDKGSMSIYYGLGARALLSSDSRLGVRIPVGLEYIFQDQPLGLFFEVAPLLDLAPETEFGVNGGIGIRYFL